MLASNGEERANKQMEGRQAVISELGKNCPPASQFIFDILSFGAPSTLLCSRGSSAHSQDGHAGKALVKAGPTFMADGRTSIKQASYQLMALTFPKCSSMRLSGNRGSDALQS